MSVNFQKSSLDKIFLGLSAILILAQIALVAIYYSSLPDIIPIHYGIDGKADGFGPKYSLWFLVGMSILIFALLFYHQNRKSQVKINWPLKEENKEAVQIFVLKWMRAIMLNIVCLFFYLALGTILIALGKAKDLNVYVILFWALINIFLVFWGIMQMQEINSGRKKIK